VYGSDAIAGVVNFITPKEYSGFNASVTGTVPEAAGGGTTYLANLSGGFGSLQDNGWNLYAGASYRKATELRNTARDFSASGYHPEHGVDITQTRSNPANYNQTATGIFDLVNPAAPGCAGQALISIDLQCNYDVLSNIDIKIPQEQWSFLTRGALKLGDNHTVSLEYVRGDSKLTAVNSPYGPTGLQMAPDSPFYPGNGITPANTDPAFDPTQNINFGWRITELGRRQSEVEGYTDRALAQLEGQLGAWDYQLFGSISTSEVKITLTQGYVGDPALREAFLGVDGVFLNPFGPQDEAGLALLKSLEINGEAQRAIGDLKVYGVQFNRQLFKLRGGPVAIAIAADYKDESARLENNFAITDALPNVFLGTHDVRGDRTAKSLSFEANLPVLENLELGLSVRYDDYSDFGNSTNPEFSVRYQPTRWLTLRGSYSRAFRAPTLYDIFQPTNIGFTVANHDDPILCPGGVVDTAAGGVEVRDCDSELMNAVNGGNPNLNPETSDAYTLGFILTPFERTSFGVDYFDYHVKDTIGTLGDVAVFEDPVKYADRIVRCSQVPANEQDAYEGCKTAPGVGDPIAYVLDTLDNLGDMKTSGFDVTADWVDGSGVLKYVHSLTLALDHGPVTLEITHHYKSGYDDCNAECVDPEFFRKVDPFQVVDLAATYRWSDHLTMFGTIRNLLDEDPPFTNGGSNLSTNWDDRYADALKRNYLLTVSYKF
jgi:iron complex outermembrane receptor protein